MDIDLEGYQFYIRPGKTDMRKGPQSLAYIAQYEMGLGPYDKAVFVFCGSDRKTVKAIVWDRNGWLCLSKRLLCGSTFMWPSDDKEARHVSLEQLKATLRGNDPWREFPSLGCEYV